MIIVGAFPRPDSEQVEDELEIVAEFMQRTAR